MIKKEAIELISAGENLRVEFKESCSGLPRSLFETVCAFLNTKGGTILLGVDDTGNITGIKKDKVSKLKKDIANLANNPQKLSPPLMLMVDEHKIENKTILSLSVPESSRVHKSGNEIFVRNEDGDFKVSYPVEIAKIVNRKQNYHSEQRVFPFVSISDFNSDLILRAKNLIKMNSSEHHWAELDNKSFLARTGFYRKDEENNQGYTLAAILFFGTDDLIQSLLPAYKFEALLRRQNIDRYDDRLTVRTNLLDAYDLLMGFVEKHLNNPFYLEGTSRINLRTKVFRELVANIIAHREYMSPIPAFINIFLDKIEFANPNNPKVFGKIDPKHFTPVAKNPAISKLMLQMGWVEEVGSGMRNVYKYLPHYSKGATVEFIDEELFSTVIHLGPKGSQIDKKDVKKYVEKDFGKISERFRKDFGKEIFELLLLIHKDPYLTAKELAKQLEKSTRTIENYLSRLKKEGVITRRGPKLGGYWRIDLDI